MANDSRINSAAHGMNVTKALLPHLSARATACGTSFADTLVCVRMRRTTVTVMETRTTAEMTMTEYRSYIWEKIDAFPFSPTRPFDEQTIKISEKCWERMKDDSEYEEKMMKIIKDGRQYPDPFFGMGSYGTYEVLDFDGGEGCHSHTWSKKYGGNNLVASSRFEKESEGGFWTNRHKRMKEVQAISEERCLERRLAAKLGARHAREARLMAQGKVDEVSTITGIPDSLLISGLGGMVALA